MSEGLARLDPTSVVTSGHEAAVARPTFEQVYAEHFDGVWRYLRRAGLPERALEDVAQDVFVVVHHQLKNFDPTKPVRPWLYGIAFRLASDHRRKKVNQETLDDFAEDREDQKPSADERLEARDRQRLVHRALSALDDARRTVFVLFELEEFTAPQIAQIENIPLNTVYSRLRVARIEFNRAVHRLKQEYAS